MKLQNLTVIFIIIIIPIILLQSVYISKGLKTINYQTLYDTGLVTATHDAIYAYELNVTNDSYSSNAQTKREVLNASIKMFERSLCKTCGISEFNTHEIENYIPAVVFGLYDGFYLYAPSVIPIYENDISGTGESAITYRKPNGTKNQHNLKSYIYYSEQIGDITIRYTLDNYVVVSIADSTNINNGIIKSGYLINGNYDAYIDSSDSDATKYLNEAKAFTSWFNTNVATKTAYGKIESGNDPEDENSAFTQHKRKIIREKIETVLNSVITAYASRTWGSSFKMPKISEENWEKILSDVSMITFFQGKNIGLTDYNGYCVLNSNNTAEYINPNLMYFMDGDGYYHDIRCKELAKAESDKGYNVSRFNGKSITVDEVNHIDSKFLNKRKYKIVPHYDTNGEEDYKQIFDENDKLVYTIKNKYTTKGYNKFKKDDNTLIKDSQSAELEPDKQYVPLACYDCINASITKSLGTYTPIYDYIKPNGGTADGEIKKAYWTSLARERYNQPKLTVPN